MNYGEKSEISHNPTLRSLKITGGALRHRTYVDIPTLMQIVNQINMCRKLNIVEMKRMKVTASSAGG